MREELYIKIVELERKLKSYSNLLELLELQFEDTEKLLKELKGHLEKESMGEQALETDEADFESNPVKLMDVKGNFEECEDNDVEVDTVVEYTSSENEKKCVMESVESVLGDDLNDVSMSLQKLEEYTIEMHTVDEPVYNNIMEIIQKYKNFMKRPCCDKDDNNFMKKISDVLKEELQEYGWANRILRLYAYSRVDKFKYPHAKYPLEQIYVRIAELYRKYSIEIFVPNLLEEEYDSSKYEKSKDNRTPIDEYCDLSAADYTGKVYDVLQVGYTIVEGDVESIQKPKIFYY